MTLSKQAEKRELVGLIDSILQDIEKQAEANTEAGGYVGASTHPSTKVDDGTEAASEGSRSAENSTDNKDEPNRGVTVDATPTGGLGGQDAVQMDIGITSKATGEDPAAETSSAKGGKEDSDSTHPARTDNNALDGGKYASDMDRLEAITKKATELGSQLVAAIAANADTSIKQSQTQVARPAAKTQVGEVKQAASTGYDLAGLFANMDVPAEDKQAVDAMVVDTLADVIGVAFRRAEKAASFFEAHFKAKQAAEECEDGEECEEGEECDANGQPVGGPKTEESSEGGTNGGPGEADIAALLAGGEGMDAGGAAAGMGAEEGAPPEIPGAPPAPGADPGMGAGGMPPMDPAAMGGDPAAMGGDPAAMGGMEGGPDMAQLEQILQELGITPEELEMAIAGKQASLLKKKHQKQAAVKQQQQQKYAAMKQMIEEMVGRSRGSDK